MGKEKNPLGLDPKKMRVKSVDKNFTTLQHRDGHEIRIAHNVLSPEAKKSLAAFGKTATNSMTPVQAQEQQESNKANSTYGASPVMPNGMKMAKGGAIQQMPRGMCYADGGDVTAPAQSQQPDPKDMQESRAQMRDAASSNQAYGTIPSAEELGKRLKNWWAEGGEVTDNKDNESSNEEHKSEPSIVDGEDSSREETLPLVKLSFAQGGKVDDESDLVHYSRQQGLKSIDPEKMGSSGVKGAQYKRGVPENKSAFYYTKNSEPESEVTSGSSAKYHAKLGPEHKVYDLNKDPDKAMQHIRDANGGAFNEDHLHSHLKSQGYHGVKWRQSPKTQVVQMYSPMSVKEEKMAEGGITGAPKAHAHAMKIRQETNDPRNIIDMDPPHQEAMEGKEETDERSMNAQTPENIGGTKRLMRGEYNDEMYAKGGKIQKKEAFGSQSSPSNPEMREKHIQQIKAFANKLLGIDVHPSGGKIDPKSGERRDENPEAGVDKPDWRSGKLEAQWNPDAIVHELAHVLLLPKGVGLKAGQKLMDKQYGDVQKNFGYMQQKKSQGEIQPMAVENMLRRMMGLPSAKQSVPVKSGEGPRTAVDTGGPAGIRVPKGEDKEVDLIRQTRLLSPENRQRIHEATSGKIKFHPEYGWQENPDAMGAKSAMYKAEKAENPNFADGGQIPHYDEGGGVDIGKVRDIVPKQEGAPAQYKSETPDDMSVGQAAGHSAATTITPELALLKGLMTLGRGTLHAGKEFATDMGKTMNQDLNTSFPEAKSAGQQQAQAPGAPPSDEVPAAPPSEQPQSGLLAAPQQNASGNSVQPDQPAAQSAQAAPNPTSTPAAPNGTVPLEQAQGAPAAQPGAPAAAPVMSPAQQQFHAVKNQTMQDMSREDQAWQHDLVNQHITPETYHSLFAKQDTLGKIGSIFGMMASSMGGAMSHQAPMFMQMMNNEIANDLEAQKTSKVNAQNFLRIMQQKELNHAQAQSLNTDTALKSWTLARIHANSAALHHMVTIRDQYPPNSPEYQKMDQTLAMLNSSFQNDNYNLMDRAASASAYMKMVMGGGDGNNASAPQQIRQKQLMGVMNADQAKSALGEAGAIENRVQSNNGMLGSFDKVNQLQHMSKYMTNPAQTVKQINAEWDAALDKFVKVNEGRVTPQTTKLMQSLKPKLTDDEETVMIKRHKLNSILNEDFATPTLDSFNIKVNKGEFEPNKTNGGQPQQSGAPQFVVGKDGKPRQVIYSNGKAYVKP